MKRLAIITARGESKRIPRKNIKDFCGKPIIAYSIEAALESKIFDEVMVSTEDEEIAKIAQAYGASIPFYRSKNTAGDYAMTIDVMTEVVEEYKKRGINPEYVCCLYPTAPFVTADKLIKAKGALEETGADAVIPVVKFSFPPQRCFIKKDSYIEYKWPENELKRSQDLEPYYHDAGQFYYLDSDIMIRNHTLAPKKTVPLIMDELEVQDIDNETDWKMAELKYKLMRDRVI